MLEVTSFRNGAVLNHSHGAETDDFLEIKVEGIADPQAFVTVNGAEACRADRSFSATVRLPEKINEIVVSADGHFGEVILRLTVLWDKKSFKRCLSFHAYSEFPDRPYQRTAPEKLAQDFDLVRDEIVRFAGEETFIPPVVIHWAMANPEVFALLKKRGMNMINGSFIGSQTYVGEMDHAFRVCDIGYFYEKDVALYLEKYKTYYDKFTGMLLNAGIGATANLYPWEELKRRILDAAHSPLQNQTIGMATHEQYSFRDYFNYIPDHLDRVEACCRLVTELGYKPVYFAEGVLGNTAWDAE